MQLPHAHGQAGVPLAVSDAPADADVLARTGFATRADLGQHFLRSPEVARRLLECAELPAGAQVLEVGAGLGTLSCAVVEAGCRIWAVEKDVRLGALLLDKLRRFGPRARVTIADVRSVDLDGGLELDSVLLAILPFDWELSSALTEHIFASAHRVVRGLVVVPSRTLDQYRAAEGEGGSLRLEEVDGISRWEFWPKAPAPLRVVSIERR
ncbi:rRNA adenine N-6-methyltransferase family protein [Streptomyces ipomoeae]|nr:rRNA adenine N-6-methyltransferase family protein [Streptomyces ipomoeae]